MAISAASVSAALRRAGFNPLGSGASLAREGLRTRQGDNVVYVRVDLDSDRAAAEMRDDVIAALTEAGYTAGATADRIIRVEAATS